MHLTNLISLLALTGYAAAACYETGFSFVEKAKVAAAARAACNGPLGGDYSGQSTWNGQRTSCINTRNGKVDFVVSHVKGGERYLGPNECFDGLNKEIQNCGKGGATTYTNWGYKVDPNQGTCT